ncbi:MAG: hypothetical protein JRJ79_15140 [Deltaproteobacteria bacterium]|nr:hypothetical protein [Deltaproteobacteria bacterium]
MEKKKKDDHYEEDLLDHIRVDYGCGLDDRFFRTNSGQSDRSVRQLPHHAQQPGRFSHGNLWRRQHAVEGYRSVRCFTCHTRKNDAP